MAVGLTIAELPGAVNAISVTPTGLTASVDYEVTGFGVDGRAYHPRGYVQRGGSEFAIIDSVYPLDGEVTYTIAERGTGVVLYTGSITPTGTNVSAPVELVSFDGVQRIEADLASDRASGLSVDWTIRRNSVMAVGSGVEYATWDTPVEGGPTVAFRVERSGMQAVRALVAGGAPVYLRMRNGWAGDTPASGLWAMKSVGYEYEGLDDETFLWVLELVPARDPQPRVGVAISSWDAFNDAMVRLGWDYTDLQNFLASFASWAEAATVDWEAM